MNKNVCVKLLIVTALIVYYHCLCNTHAHLMYCREFFELLSQELVDPQYALFQSINGLYKPSQSSSVNSNHIIFFDFFGKIIGRAICDGT